MRRGKWMSAVLMLTVIACTQREVPHSVWPAEGISLREGDVVFRLGMGVCSRVVINADKGGSYSHVGIVVRDSGQLMIVHAVPYEGDFDGVKRELPEEFWAATRASAGAVCRLEDSLTAVRAACEALSFYRRQMPFDHSYDEADTTRLYCCQLVTLAYQRAGVELVAPDVGHQVALPWLSTGRCLFPSDLWRSPQLKMVWNSE